MSKKRTGNNIQAYMGVEAVAPPQFEVHYQPPTAKEFKYNLGTFWLDRSADKVAGENILINDVYCLVDKRSSSAVWVSVSDIGTNKLTGDTGGAVSKDINNNINLLGTNGLIVTTGTLFNNTITWDIADSFPDLYNADSGSATPAVNTLTIEGGVSITTSASGSTVTITYDNYNSNATDYTTDAGTANPASNNINILGDGIVFETSATGSAVTIGATSEVATTYSCDTGSATPAANTINIVGAGGVTTTGAGSTISIDYSSAGTDPAFFATLSASVPNFCGKYFGGFDTLPFDSELFDTGADYNTGTYTFTAPVDGIYFFRIQIFAYDIRNYVSSGTSLTNMGLSIYNNTTGSSLLGRNINPYEIRLPGDDSICLGSEAFVQASSGDEFIARLQLEDVAPLAADNITIDPGSTNNYKSFFCGHLVLDQS